MREFCIIISVLFQIQAIAQVKQLTLNNAIESFLQNNYQIKILQNQAQIANNNNTFSNAGRAPSINFIASQTNSFINQKPANPFALAGKNLSDNLNAQVDVQWTLFNGNKVNIQTRYLTYLAQQSEGNVTLLIQNQLQNLIQAYRLALYEQQKLEIRKEMLSLSLKRFEYASLKKEYGQFTSFDILQEKSSLMNDSIAYEQQNMVLQNARKKLFLIMATEFIDNVFLSDSLKLDKNVGFDLNSLKEKANKDNQNIKNQFLALQIAKTNTDLAKSNSAAQILMNTGINGTYNTLSARFPTDRTFSNFQNRTISGYATGAYLNFSLRYNLYNGSQVKRTIQNAVLQEKNAETSLQEMNFQLNLNLENVYNQYLSQKKIYRIIGENVNNSYQIWQIANEKYKQGLINSIDIRTIQLNYLNNNLMYLDALIDILDLELELTKLSGGLMQSNDK
jgi:outer membrane protein